jgi:hypothetical protein
MQLSPPYVPLSPASAKWIYPTRWHARLTCHGEFTQLEYEVLQDGKMPDLFHEEGWP